MGLLDLLTYSARSAETSSAHPVSDLATQTSTESPPAMTSSVLETPNDATEDPLIAPALLFNEPQSIPKIVVSKPTNSESHSIDSVAKPATDGRPQVNFRRFSLRAFSLNRAHDKPIVSVAQEQEHEKKAYKARKLYAIRQRFTSSDKRAKQSALVLRSIIVGGPPAATPQITPTNARPELSRIKAQLNNPKSANKLIAQLRALPISDVLPEGKSFAGAGANVAQGPIHAVCLEHPDAEEEKLHFAPLRNQCPGANDSDAVFGGKASVEQVMAMFNDMNIVNLMKPQDLGLGQPGSGPGLLSGALPTAETVIKGFEQITPQLMALGYATGKAIIPDHAGIYPPTDRMSVITYWWGFELVLPPPTLKHLADAKSIAGTIVNLLTALALINNGVREILPFVRYISQFIDYEFDNIKKHDVGRGVVCAATWIMPAALVARPWDFPDPPPTDANEEKEKVRTTKQEPTPQPPNTISPLPPTSPVPSPDPVVDITPPSLPTFADSMVNAYADSVHFPPVVLPAKADPNQ
ncbi:hypothetical protein H0H81_005325 [Sphagnurus paluster]|uniref:Uncharacterized protein n=1 Tax=Sphagnurus paluster TaxID=117069 RepID=A0A9P7KJ81_9AGAR|nr:hypothetical protein H0H81_005325 [Sphagnurus paluster]